ncbi:MAG: AI-2E family transporter, partial [Candidatus Saccharimonadales bacterium]
MGIVAFVAIMILIAHVAFNVLLLALAGCLIAVYFHGLGDMIERYTKWRRRLCMTVSIAGTFILLCVLFWFMGSKIQGQISILSNSLPHTIKVVKSELSQTQLGSKLLEIVQGTDQNKLAATGRQFFSTSFGVLGNMYIILFLGIFFTASPSLYKDGFILLVPPKSKPLAKTIIYRTSRSLRSWLKVTMLSMVLI